MSHYTAAYRQALIAAYNTPVGWSKAVRAGEARFVTMYAPRINLGARSGKTTTAIEYAQSKDNVLIVTATEDQALAICKRAPTIRAESVDVFTRRTRFMQDTFVIFDDTDQLQQPMGYQSQATSKKTMVAILAQKPDHFICLGESLV